MKDSNRKPLPGPLNALLSIIAGGFGIALAKTFGIIGLVAVGIVVVVLLFAWSGFQAIRYRKEPPIQSLRIDPSVPRPEPRAKSKP